MSEVILSVKNLTASIDGNQILKGVNLEIKA
ncbi:MAG: ABC transporter ATP-binding protein, partial [Microcystis aeruginosa]